MATLKRKGYGQVEPNHLSGIVTGQIYAQLPAAAAVAKLENGQFMVYNYAAGEVSYTGDGEPMLVYNEEKLYDERQQSHKDFVYKVGDFSDGKLYPRLIKTNVGDIMTTNALVGPNTSNTAEINTSLAIAKNDYLVVDTTNGFLKKSTATGMPTSGMVWKVVKEYTMPDGQPGVKIQRVQ